MRLHKKQIAFIKWVTFLLTLTFFFYEYYLRVSPTAIIPELMTAFNIGAGAVGTISAFYFYSYSVMQVPAGFFTDKLGARMLLIFSSAICGVGCIIFAIAQHTYMAALSRLLIGFGSAFGWVGIIYVVTHWFEQKKWALLIGIANSIGMMGAIIGEGPLALLVSIWGWREVFFFLGFIGFIISLAMLILMRNQPKGVISQTSAQKTNEYGFFQSLWIVMKNYHSWTIGIASCGYYVILPVFAGLWGTPYLQISNGFSKEYAGFAASLIFLGFVIGGPLVGYLSDHLKNRKRVLLIFMILTTLCFLPIIHLSPMPNMLVLLLLFLTGFFASGQLLTFTFAIEWNLINVKATAAAFVNAIVFIGTAFLQTVIGYSLDLGKTGTAPDALPVYSIKDYEMSFLWLSSFLLVSLLIAFFTQESPKTDKERKQFDHLECPE